MSSPSMPRLQSSTRIVRKPNSKECIAVEAAKTEKNLKKVHLKTASSTSSLENMQVIERSASGQEATLLAALPTQTSAAKPEM